MTVEHVTPLTGLAHDDATSLETLRRYQRLTNYLAAAQVYLKANALLREPLAAGHVKERLLGHWGTCPGINAIYAHLNRLILRTDADVLLVTGPGHGAAANIANLYLEGSLADAFPDRDYALDASGVEQMVRDFSWPNRIASHLTPAIPGTIYEGGELGYALGTSFGAALDNPELLVACIVGDGEAETGPTAGAWHLTKFLDPVTSGAVLPILHLNGYKIASQSIFATMSLDEIVSLFTGYGWDPIVVDGETGPDLDRDLAAAMDEAWSRIREIQDTARSGAGAGDRPIWPMIVLRTPKGMTGVASLDGEPIVDTPRSHQIPVEGVRENPEHLAALEAWLRAYRPDELVDESGRPATDILSLCPAGDRRMGANPRANGGQLRQPPPLPSSWREFAVPVDRPGETFASSAATGGDYLAATIRSATRSRDFRIFCPDELESNKLGAVLEETNRAFVGPLPSGAPTQSPDGLVVETLSEHNCQAMLQGYVLTGRHGIFPCYEAFVAIVDSMVNQHAKFMKVMGEVPWRAPVSSLNYLLTSESWRQEHNGYSHQGPGFINHLISKKASMVRIYLPPDANCFVQTLDHCLWGTGRINLVIAAKQPMPQWLGPDEAEAHCVRGASTWGWASTNGGVEPDVVLASAGDNPTLETMAAAQHLLAEVPDLRIRVVNVTDLMVLGLDTEHPHGLTTGEFDGLFTSDKPVVFTFHGYAGAIRQLLFGRPAAARFDIAGYREEGTTTTPFDMQTSNGTSRWQIVQRAVGATDALPADRAKAIVAEMDERLAGHKRYIAEHGTDPEEITGWKWERP